MTSKMQPGAAMTEPWQQGNLDALCGLYAIINALRLLHAPTGGLSRQVCKTLYRDGLEAACRMCDGLNPIFDGMTQARQMKVAKAIFKSRALRDRAPSVLHKPQTGIVCNADLDRIWQDCLGRGDVLLADFDGRISHHTVICGLSDDSIFLFDSDKMRFVFRRTLQLSAMPDGKLILNSVVPIGPRSRSLGHRAHTRNGRSARQTL